MPYTPTIWRDKRAGGTMINAESLNKIENGIKAATDLAELVAPVGCIMAWAGTGVPEGWLLCDGRSLSRASYPKLFSAIGVVYGSSSQTMFSLPDMRTRVPVGRNPTGTFATLGAKGGSERHTLTTAEIPAHNHNATTGGRNMGMWKTNSSGGSQWELLSTSGASQVSGFEISNTGGGQSHNNLQPYIVVNYIIKAA